MKNSPLDKLVDAVEGRVERDLETSDDDDEMGPFPAIIIDIFEGKVADDTDYSKRLCKLEGSVRVFDGPRLSTLQEVAKLLEITTEKYAAPKLSSDCTTAFISLNSLDETVPFARIDARVDDGYAYATLHFADGAERTVRRVASGSCDDAMVLLHRVVLRAQSESK